MTEYPLRVKRRGGDRTSGGENWGGPRRQICAYFSAYSSAKWREITQSWIVNIRESDRIELRDSTQNEDATLRNLFAWTVNGRIPEFEERERQTRWNDHLGMEEGRSSEIMSQTVNATEWKNVKQCRRMGYVSRNVRMLIASSKYDCMRDRSSTI